MHIKFVIALPIVSFFLESSDLSPSLKQPMKQIITHTNPPRTDEYWKTFRTQNDKVGEIIHSLTSPQD